jgi:hypothetical protein
MTAKGFWLGAVGDFEAQNPRFCKTAVIGCSSFVNMV